MNTKIKMSVKLLPNPEAKASVTLMAPLIPKAMKLIKLGQSISTNVQPYKSPKNTPNTRIPKDDIPPKGGITYPKANIRNSVTALCT